jgi:23S rRNA pseudouridine1911/1915/1917 synthase
MIEVLIEDSWFLVINKPIDLLTQAVAGVSSVQSQLTEQFRVNASTPFVGMPHRLDRMTSGVLVIARNQRALRRLSEQFAARSVRKDYLAWVFGNVEDQGVWTDWIRKIPDVAKAELVEPEVEGARLAELEFQTLDRRTINSRGMEALASGETTQLSQQAPSLETLQPRQREVSLVRVALKTGRMHQIRIQFASRGHPILGDATYGGGIDFARQERETREPMLALHASRLEFSHPKTGERVVALARTPESFPWNLPLAPE